MNIKIRDLTTEDLDQIYKLGVFAKDFQVGEETGFYDKQYLKTWIRNKRDDILLVADKGNNVVGFLFVRVCFKTWAHGENIYIILRERGLGIEDLLFTECQKRLKKIDIDYISWLVKPKGFEKDFVEKAGFKKGEQFLWYEKKTNPLWPGHEKFKR